MNACICVMRIGDDKNNRTSPSLVVLPTTFSKSGKSWFWVALILKESWSTLIYNFCRPFQIFYCISFIMLVCTALYRLIVCRREGQEDLIDVFRTLSNIQDGAFCKNSHWLSATHYFCKTLHLWCLRFWRL